MTSAPRPSVSPPSLRPARLDLGLADLADAYDLILCDVWGVIHDGMRHHEAAVDALRRFRRGGGTVVLVTNAPVPGAQVARRLDALAVPRDAYDGIASSGDVTIAMIVAAHCPPLFHIGPPDEIGLYREAGRLGPCVPALVAVSRARMAVCVGLDGVRETPAEYDEVLGQLRARGLALVCANPDLVVEVGDALVVCAGAIAARYEAMGGAVVQAGKPFPAIYERAIGTGTAARGAVSKRRILAIGDAMRTDMRGAHLQGIDSLFISGGIHRAALHGNRRDAQLEAETLARFLADHDARPLAAMPVLFWDHRRSAL